MEKERASFKKLNFFLAGISQEKKYYGSGLIYRYKLIFKEEKIK